MVRNADTNVNKLLTEQRRRRILESVDSLGLVNTDDLVGELGVSPMTVWRDLIALEQDGKVRRIRGGAVRVEASSTGEPFYKSKQVLHKEQKLAIGRYTAQHFVNDNDIIILEAGTTVGAMIGFLKQRGLTVISNGLGNLNELSLGVPELTVLSCGGMLRDVAMTFVGPQAIEFFSSVRAHTFFLSSTGLAFPEGITDPNLFEIQIKRAMADSAARVVLMIDSTKFGVRSLSPILSLERVRAVVTDHGAPAEDVLQLREMGIEVHLAS